MKFSNTRIFTAIGTILLIFVFVSCNEVKTKGKYVFEDYPNLKLGFS